MPAPGREPVGERDEDNAFRPGHPHHLRQHGAPVTDVFEHVGGERHIHRPGAEREAQRAADGAAGLRPARGSKFPAVGVHAYRPRTRVAQLAHEEARAGTDVDHEPPVQIHVLAELADGVPGKD